MKCSNVVECALLAVHTLSASAFIHTFGTLFINFLCMLGVQQGTILASTTVMDCDNLPAKSIRWQDDYYSALVLLIL